MLLNIFKDKPANEDYHTVHLLGLVLEWLLFCIEHHNYHIKICIINKDLLRQILVLMKSPHTFLVLGAIRFLRYKRRHNLLVVAQTFKTIKNKNDHQQERLKETQKGVGALDSVPSILRGRTSGNSTRRRLQQKHIIIWIFCQNDRDEAVFNFLAGLEYYTASQACLIGSLRHVTQDY
ncbi:hypothetical protein pipiens_016775 [Culex pipiens pipiens]|uniref:Serine/threonine-protein phosphatase 4 regulatory subunit 3-like central domain-containing protein n=1 Tax=Culex pipiens pipiens TaxID=38569 RepID=A0ABD1CKM7_CULPP